MIRLGQQNQHGGGEKRGHYIKPSVEEPLSISQLLWFSVLVSDSRGLIDYVEKAVEETSGSQCGHVQQCEV